MILTSFAFGPLCNALTSGYFIDVQYVEPVFERLNSRGTISHRLSRPATKYLDGKHYRYADCRDLPNFSALGIRTHSLTLVDTLAPE